MKNRNAHRIIDLIDDAGRVAVPLPGDISQAAHCRAMVAEAAARLGGLDVVVNNAGKQRACEDLRDLSDEQFDETMKTNVHSMFWIIKAPLDHLGPGSTIVNTASLEAYKPAPILVDYATSKGAINVFTKALAQQLAPKGIRMNAVAPGPVWTALQVSAELAPAYVFLASAESSFVAGETLNVNGGTPTP